MYMVKGLNYWRNKIIQITFNKTKKASISIEAFLFLQ